MYDDFKLKKNIWSRWFLQMYFTALRLKGLTQAKIIKKSVILFWLLNMAI